MCGIRLYEYDDVCQRVCVELLNDHVVIDWVGRMGDRDVDDNRGTQEDQEPLLPREIRYLELSRIPLITADSVLPQHTVRGLQENMSKQGLALVATSAGGQEYKTRTGLVDTKAAKWDNKCFMATLLKAREVCNATELDRIPESLTELMAEFCEGAKRPAFLQEFLLGIQSMGASEGVLRELCDKARVRRADLSQ